MFAAKSGAISCPGYQCPAPSIKPQVLAEHVSEEVFGEYNAALKKMEEQEINATLGESITLRCQFIRVKCASSLHFTHARQCSYTYLRVLYATTHNPISSPTTRERLRPPAGPGGEGVGRAERGRASASRPPQSYLREDLNPFVPSMRASLSRLVNFHYHVTHANINVLMYVF